MDCRHGDTKACRRANGMGDSVRNVMKFQIEKDLAPTRLYRLDHGGALSREEFQTDLAECWRFTVIGYGIDESQGSIRIGNIEGDDDFVLGSGR
jgi:hypothetical protein